MPNWCQCKLKIDGPQIEINKFTEPLDVKGDKYKNSFLETHNPTPKNITQKEWYKCLKSINLNENETKPDRYIINSLLISLKRLLLFLI